MKLNEHTIEEAKQEILKALDECIYDELKNYIDIHIDENQDYSEVLDYFCNNLTGSLTWSV